MKARDIYLNQLKSFRDKPFIKVITGIRRCGKSTLLDLFEEYLLEDGILPEQIVRMNFESLDFDEIKTYKELNAYIQSKKAPQKKTYILLDEIQQVDAWEKAINSFLVSMDADIYITGSNAYLLSSELSTFLSGRYVEIKMLPLSFKEYLDFNEGNLSGTPEKDFNRYLEYGGLPAIPLLNNDRNMIRSFLSGIFNTVLIKDVVQRNQVRDAALLESVVRYVVQNIGCEISTKKIADYLISAGRKTTHETIDNYLKMLQDAFILYKAERFDIKGKLYLKTLEKYYVTDTGLRNELLGFRNDDYGHVLENVVYFELLRRGCKVSVGKIGALEIDFIAESADKKTYYQVCASILDDETRKRELKPFELVDDHYEKVVLSMDRTPVKDFNGIVNRNILDFLLGE